MGVQNGNIYKYPGNIASIRTKWIVLTTIGWVLALLFTHIPIELWYVFPLFAARPPVDPVADSFLDPFAVISYALAGLAVGGLQAISRQFVRKPLLWILATIIGMVIGQGVGWYVLWSGVDPDAIYSNPLYLAMPASGGASASSLAQWLILRHQYRRAGWWIMIGPVVWIPVVGGIITSAILLRLHLWSEEVSFPSLWTESQLFPLYLRTALITGLVLITVVLSTSLYFLIKDVSSDIQSKISIKNQTQDTPLVTMYGHELCVHSVAWSLDGSTVYSAGCDRTVRLWDSESGASLKVMELDFHGISRVVWSPEHSLFASTQHDKEAVTDTLVVWDAETGNRMDLKDTFEGWIQCMSWSPDGSMLAVCVKDSAASEPGIEILDIETGDILSAIQPGFIGDIAWSPDNQKLAVGGNDISVWDAESGECVFQINTNTPLSVSAVAWSPDGRFLASSYIKGGYVGEAPVQIWDADTGNKTIDLDVQTENVTTLAFSPDGRLLAVGWKDQAIVVVWDAETGERLHIFDGHLGGVFDIDWSPDGTRLAVASQDDSVKIWGIP